MTYDLNHFICRREKVSGKIRNVHAQDAVNNQVLGGGGEQTNKQTSQNTFIFFSYR